MESFWAGMLIGLCLGACATLALVCICIDRIALWSYRTIHTFAVDTPPVSEEDVYSKDH